MSIKPRSARSEPCTVRRVAHDFNRGENTDEEISNFDPLLPWVLLVALGLASPSRAETGAVRVVFTKGGFIVGVGSGRGVLIFRGHRYPFRVGGMSVGFTIGASTTQLRGGPLI